MGLSSTKRLVRTKHHNSLMLLARHDLLRRSDQTFYHPEIHENGRVEATRWFGPRAIRFQMVQVNLWDGSTSNNPLKTKDELFTV